MITKLNFYCYFKVNLKKKEKNSTEIPVTGKMYEEVMAYIYTEDLS